MTEKRSKRMAPVVQFERMKEEQAARTLSQARSQCLQEQEKLDQLRAYAEGYQEGLAKPGQSGVSPLTMQTFHNFMQRLNVAVEQQQQQVQRSYDQLEQQQKVWQQQQGARKGMEKLVERYQGDEQKVEARNEQKQQDELARQLLSFNRLNKR